MKNLNLILPQVTVREALLALPKCTLSQIRRLHSMGLCTPKGELTELARRALRGDQTVIKEIRDKGTTLTPGPDWVVPPPFSYPKRVFGHGYK